MGDSINMVPPPFSNTHDNLPFITIDQLKKLISGYSSAKSGGPDALHARMFKCLARHSAQFLGHLQQLFLALFQYGVTPSVWNISLIHLIPKGVGAPTVSTCRPISLTCILRRFFELAVLKVINSLHHPAFETSANQSGFKAGFACEFQALYSDHLSKTRDSISVFLDLAQAYDTVSHSKLLSILIERQVPNQLIRLVYHLHAFRSKSIITANHRQHPDLINRSRGLAQGSPLSPMIFNLYIDKLARSSPKILLLADDIA